MTQKKTSFASVKLSLVDILGESYIDAVCRARSVLSGESIDSLRISAYEKKDFFPETYHTHLTSLLPYTGERMIEPFESIAKGAAPSDFSRNSNIGMSPLNGFGYYRLGEDGCLYLISKSEHYHATLGHGFPGYRLLDVARSLGIPNATHNNTRGHITRLLEEELIRTATGLESGNAGTLDQILLSENRYVLNRVLNLETGSLALEAALKMVLSRFYAMQYNSPVPVYAGRIPVVLVIGDEEEGLTANYHGTTVLTQIMRGMWAGPAQALEEAGIFIVRGVRPNRIEDMCELIDKYDHPPYKVAAFFHEIVMMNYGALCLAPDFLRQAYDLCATHDVLTVCDEIQSCVWSPSVFMFHEFNLAPSFVALGKGIPGGEYAASRLLFSAAFDMLPQFGALVTNGQEELASLVYLITIQWAKENAEITEAVGAYYEERLREMGNTHNRVIASVEGLRHLASVHFHDVELAQTFSQRLNKAGFDISVQVYKAGCPPSALTKLPLIAGYEVVDTLLDSMNGALQGM